MTDGASTRLIDWEQVLTWTSRRGNYLLVGVGAVCGCQYYSLIDSICYYSCIQHTDHRYNSLMLCARARRHIHTDCLSVCACVKCVDEWRNACERACARGCVHARVDACIFIYTEAQSLLRCTIYTLLVETRAYINNIYWQQYSVITANNQMETVNMRFLDRTVCYSQSVQLVPVKSNETHTRHERRRCVA